MRRFSFGWLLLLVLALGLSGCQGPGNVKLKVTGVSLAPGGTGTVTIEAINPPDLKTLQVGPTGAFTFDPAVIQVLDVRGLNGFQVLAATINNLSGFVQFAAGFPGGAIGPIFNLFGGTELGLVELEVQAVGPSGSSSPLALTAVDVLADRNGEEIPLAGLLPGEARIR